MDWLETIVLFRSQWQGYIFNDTILFLVASILGRKYL